MIKNKGMLLIIFLFSSLLLIGQEHEIIVLGIVDTSPPYMFVNSDNQPDGFAIDLFTRMMGDLEIPYEIRVENFTTLYQDLLKGQIDIFPGMIYSKEREEVLYYPSTPLLTSWGELFVAEDTFYTEITDLSGKTVGMVKDDLNGKNFIDFMKTFDIHYNYVEFDSFEELFYEVKKGSVYGGISSNQHQLREPGIKATTTIFSPTSAYAVTGRNNGNIPVLNKLSDYLRELKSDSHSYYYDLQEKWYRPAGKEIGPKFLRRIILSLIILTGIFFFLFLNILYLKSEVKRQVEEINLQQREKEKVALKNEFLSSVSHELRTPMNIITNMIYLHSQTELTESQREQVGKISRASHHLISIINNFLDFNKLDRNGIEQEKRAFSPNNDINEIVSLFQDELKQNSLTMDVHFDNQIPPVLRGDSFRMTQILTNLINNAIKFSDKGKITLTVSAEKETDRTCHLVLSLKDQGIGIADDKIPDLFRPFSQADSSISRRYGGSGLGLAICQQLVELLKGTIQVNSKKGVGTEFIVNLPFEIADQNDLKVETGGESIMTFPGARILFVEDNDINREIGLELMNMAQIEATAAKDGLEAVESAARERPDLIFMDVQMPRMDGLTAVRNIRAHEKKENLKPVPIIALTAHFLQEDIQKAYEAGMNGYISKPISIRDLNRELKKWLKTKAEEKRERSSSVSSEILPVPGVNMDNVRERFGKDNDLFYTSIGHFIEDYSSFTDKLMSHKEEKEVLLRDIHSLTGLLGTLGMESLARDWRALESSLKISSPRDIEPLLQKECRKLDEQLELLINWRNTI